MGDVDHARHVPDDLVELGRIVAAHGVRGQIKIHPHAVGSDTLLAHKTWWLGKAATPVVRGGVPATTASAAASSALCLRPVRVLVCQRRNDALIAQIEGVVDREQAQALKGATLHLPRGTFPGTADDEYYWVDLIGCVLYGKNADAQDVLLGQVSHVSDNGAHAVLHVCEVLPDDMRRTRPKERLIPFVAAHILHVSLSERRIDSNWPADF